MKKPNKSVGDIAIIGMAGRFPGAGDVPTFWENLKNGVESVSFLTDEELTAAGVQPQLLANPSYVKARPVLDDVDKFDAEFFNISPREAETMDPQHRLFLESSWAALEDAGYDSDSYEGAIGVYGGSYFDTYLLANICTSPQRTESLLNHSEPGTFQTYLGNDKDFLTSRVAYKLNLKGPAMTILTGCSSSLVAVCQACQSLLYYQCDMALAGGVAIIVPQMKGYLYQEGGMQSPDGHCRVFDAKAQGTIFGSGVGLVVLKRAEEAVADGDHIYAVIKGSAVNNDGSVKVSYTAPSVDGQTEVIALAQALAGVTADSINYIEAHGTGTPLGDPIEVAALTQAFQQSTDKRGFCGIGSLKSNVGHMDAAAGVAGVIKTAKALQHKLIPPTLHFTSPNPKIDFANSPFYVVTKPTAWANNGAPRRAGVSAFGVGGTNAHVVLEEAPAIEASGESRGAQLIMLSAKTPAALDRVTAGMATHLKANPELNLADVAYTLQMGRHALPHRRVVVCRDAADAVTQLENPDPKRVFTQTLERRDPSVVFMFPGQGAQYFGMGQEIYRSESVFREVVDRCVEYLRPILGVDLRTIMFSADGSEKEAGSLLIQTRFTQPALFVLEYALAQLWMSWGIQPSAMIGHSIGEYVAACLAGVFSLEEALKLIAERGRLVQQQPGGAMLSVRLPETEMRPYLQGDLSIAAINTAGSCVIAGSFEAIDAVELRLKDAGVSIVRLQTSHAFHSAMMDPVVEPFIAIVRQTSFHAPRIPYVSNVTGKWITPDEARDPRYWAAHLRQPVRFAEGVAQFMQDPTTVLLEVGPGRVLTSLARQHPARKLQQVVVNSLVTGEELDALLTATGRLWLAGAAVDAAAFFGDARRQRLSLPTYPFERKRYWVEPDTASSLRQRVTVSEPARTPMATQSATRAGELKALLTELSGKDYSDVDENLSFVELGFESLFLAQVSMAIANRFGAQIAFREFFGEINTVALLAAHLEKIVPFADGVPPAAVATVAGEPQSAPLTEAQREVWLATAMSDAASCAFNQSSTVRLRGPLQREALGNALQELVQRHDGLRTTFSAGGDLQTASPRLATDLSFHDLDGRVAELDGLLLEEASLPFDLVRGPLLRVRLVKLGQQDHVLLLTVHHIVCDGRSQGLLLHELGELYSARCDGRAAALPPARSLMAYAADENRQADSSARKASEAYWVTRYSEQPPALELPADFPRPAQKSSRGALVTFEFPSALCGELKRAGARQGYTLFTTLLAASYALLYRLSGQEDIVIGVPFATPGTEASESLIAHTVNFLPLRSRLSGDMSWGEHLQAVKHLVLEAFEHRHFTYGSLIQKLKLARDPSRIPLVAVGFNLAPGNHPPRFKDLQVKTELNPHSFTNVDLTFDFNQDGDALTLDCIFNTDLFEEATVRHFAGYFSMLLEGIVADPERSISALPIFTDEERRQLVVDWNDTAVEFAAKNLCLHQLIGEQAALTPDRVAVVFGREKLTYGELNRRANQLAHHLVGLGVGPEVLVGLYVERSIEMVVGILGILKAGGAYVPLDPAFPQGRLGHMVEDSKMSVLLTHRGLEDKLQVRLAGIVRLDSDWNEIAKRSTESAGLPAVARNNRAYVLYTSGSTGKPKGVEIPHSAIVNFLLSMQREPGFSGADTLLAVTTLSFDIAGLEIYLPLIVGGRTVIASREDTRDPMRLIQRMQESGCTVMQATPATWRTLIQAGWSGSPNLKVLCGGEALLRDLAEELLPRCAELWNMYGPTETTVWSAVYKVTSARESVPIGKPIANTQLFVLDAQRNLVPPGMLGELYIGGDGLARGYLHREELTREKFVPSPFAADALLYRTGDLARWLAGGIVECLGRVDNQVKVRGYRIELGEIEAVLNLHPEIRQCAAMAREDGPGDKQLIAYFEVRPGQAPNVSELRAHLEKYLPAYMIPSAFVAMEKLPLTPNGKIDRKALPHPDKVRLSVFDAQFVAPRDPVERGVADIWSQTLGIEHIGIRDNFFELGGNSLKAVQICFKLRTHFGTEVPLSLFYQDPTIQGLALSITAPRKDVDAPWAIWQHYRNEGSQPPLIGLHGVDSVFAPIAHHVDSEFPFHDLTSRVGFDGSVPPYYPCRTVEEMAERYLEYLRAFRPRGPYLLIGFCLGGLIAYEVARRLTEAGEEVPFLGLINSAPSANPIFNRSFGKRLRSRLHKLAPLDFQARMDYVRARITNSASGYTASTHKATAKIKKAIWPNAGPAQGSHQGALTPELLVKQIADFGLDMTARYLPLPYKGKVWLFHGRHMEPEDRWVRLIRGGIESYLLPGEHLTMMEEPYVRQVAEKLNASLEKSLSSRFERREAPVQPVDDFEPAER